MAQVSRKYPKGESPRERIFDAARRLFGTKGFHPTTIAELAGEARVSMGQLYRHFDSKDAIIAAIAEQESQTRLAAMHRIFDGLERKEYTTLEAVKAIADLQAENVDAGLFYEILAEGARNPAVATLLRRLTEYFQDCMRRLALLARPDAQADELEAYVEIMTACFIGLGYRQLLSPSDDVERTSQITACLMMRTLGLPV